MLEDRDCEGYVNWVAYTRDQGFWDSKRVERSRHPWPDRAETTVMWTDQYSNLFGVINTNFVDFMRDAFRLD